MRIMRKDLYRDLETQEKTHWWHLSKKRLVRSILKKYCKKQPTILDVGCGSGMILEEFSDIGKMWGIDFEKEAIDICKEKGLNNVKLGSVEKLPPFKQKFDCILALDVIEHVDEDKALNEIYKALKPKGKLIITVPAYQWMWSTWDVILHHKKRYTASSLKSLLESHNFTQQKLSYFYSFLLPPVYIIRKMKNQKSKKEYKSDFLISSKFINMMLGSLAKIELAYFQNHTIPFGLSVVAVAQKK
jgi:ubiquinone/menaquinone biosynthesis C-methylase UbiE